MKPFTHLLFALIASLMILPNARAAQGDIPPNAIVVNVNANGEVVLNRERLDYSSLADRIRSASGKTDNPAVVIVASPMAAFRDVVNVLEIARASGIERVGILKAQSDGPARVSVIPVNATVLTVDQTGELRLNGKKIKLKTLASQLKQTFKRRTDRTLYIEAYGLLSFAAMDNVIDTAKAAGAGPIGLVSQP